MKRLIDFFYKVANILYPLNWFGFLVGYGGCAHCKGGWKWKKGYSIPYGGMGAMSPLCQRCFNLLSTDEVIKYSENLANRWKKEEERFGLPLPRDYDLLIQNIREAIRYLKSPNKEEPPFPSSFWPRDVNPTQ